MEFLDKAATLIFVQLIDRLKGEQHCAITNEPYMLLTIENIGQSLDTPWGIANMYSLCHYSEQNGDLMQDPEMCFFITNEGESFTPYFYKIKIAPYMFQQAYAAIYEESVRMQNHKLTVFNRKMQKDHTEFANQWLRNIEQQGFLTANL